MVFYCSSVQDQVQTLCEAKVVSILIILDLHRESSREFQSCDLWCHEQHIQYANVMQNVMFGGRGQKPTISIPKPTLNVFLTKRTYLIESDLNIFLRNSICDRRLTLKRYAFPSHTFQKLIFPRHFIPLSINFIGFILNIFVITRSELFKPRFKHKFTSINIHYTDLNIARKIVIIASKIRKFNKSEFKKPNVCMYF